MKTILIFLVLLYAGAAGLAHVFADRLIFLPPASSYPVEQAGVRRIPAGSGEWLATHHLPNRDARFTVIFSHGNAEDLGHVAPFLSELRDRGFAVLGYDYRGYGTSSGGPPTARKASEDLATVYRYATRELQIAPRNIVLYGRSVGSGPATELAAREPIGGLVLESAFVSTYRVMTRYPLLPGDRFPNLGNIRRVTAPVLVIHGEADEMIPFWHGKRLYAAAPGPKRHLWVEHGTHNDVTLVAGESYWRALDEFRELLESGAH
jgi:abhydrolase domain-containing protein 17